MHDTYFVCLRPPTLAAFVLVSVASATAGDYFPLPGRWLGDDFYTVLPIKDGLFNEGVQLFSWSESDEALLPIGEPQVMALGLNLYAIGRRHHVQSHFSYFSAVNSENRFKIIGKNYIFLGFFFF